jgi:hypothetical protein
MVFGELIDATERETKQLSAIAKVMPDVRPFSQIEIRIMTSISGNLSVG